MQELATKTVALAGLDEGLANCSLSLDDAVRAEVVWGICGAVEVTDATPIREPVRCSDMR